ncbi:hypothetical protein [Kitasatospora sp. A2-31]|uniref:hypothetical protein n=1 Tax=Kitasatospora sp. A2-31 TaxID=2916414 RepID=UPI001EE92D54|nr:hypothetical protein [Kitasatospora sp. A2-31]MCG6493437.1 hypothetical protein [Kitasatospora sp. A2-31]
MTVQPWYATREDVKNALDLKETARSNGQVDRAIDAASRLVEGLCHRRFYPDYGTRYFDWPDQYARPWRLWLDDSELISLTAVSSGGVTIPTSRINLEPNRCGPPYNRVEIQLDTDSAFGGGSTPQRDITITGLWGYRNDESPAGTVTATASDTVTTVVVSNASAVGVGSVLRIGTERLVVTERAMTSTGQALQTPLTAAKNAETVAVADGTAFAVGEVLLLDAERMRITDIAGNNLIVDRAWDGSTLAAHAAPTIYASRSLTVTRGALGTTAAAIAQNAPAYCWNPPGPVRSLVIAEAVNTLLQESSGYARTTGTGTSSRQVGGGTVTKTAYGAGLDALREQVYVSHGRKARVRAV